MEPRWAQTQPRSGLTLAGIAYLKLISRRTPRPVKTHHKKQTKTAPKTQKAPDPKPVQEEPFTLSAESEPVQKKRTRKPADPNAPKKPRTPRKKKEADPNAPPKPRKPRKKKQTVETE